MDNVGKPAQPPPPTRQRRRLEPSEKQLKQQTSHHNPPQRQRSFQQTQTIMAGLYDLEETLGKGHFATVKAAKHVFTGERVAVKVIDKTKLDTISQKALLKEVLCMKLVQHPNVVKLYEVIDTSSKMFLVLELGQGDLYDLILRQQGGLPEAQARVYFKQIVKAVSYCHKLHVAHRDLKPENVVFFPHQQQKASERKPPPTEKQQSTLLLGQLKLTDFGFSNKFCPGVKLETSCGSLAYSAPEILLGDSYDAPAVDIWSLGVILYMLVAGRAPFQEANDSETLTMIMDVKYTIPEGLTKELKDLIRRMLVRDPRRRARLGEIETHEWVTASGEYDDAEERDDVECYFHSGGNEPQQCCGGVSSSAVPLIASNTLSEGERERIIGEMVKGGVVSAVEEVKGSLNSNAYNHITSTYYLLAERYLREKALRSRHHHHRRLSSEQPPPPNLLPTQPLPPTPDDASSSSTQQQQQSPQKHSTRIRKNSHQFEDVILPSSPATNPSPKQPAKKHETQTIESLDLETTSSRTVVHHHAAPAASPSPFQPSNEEEEDAKRVHESRNNSPHHPHYYHHLGARVSTSPTQQESQQQQQSPPKHCNERSQRMRPHHSHSDSSDEGGGGGAGVGTGTPCNPPQPPPSISIVVSEEEPPQQQQQHTTTSNNNVLLKPSPSYSGIPPNDPEELDDDDDDELKKRNKTKKKRILFLSWFFNKKSSSSGGGSSKGSGKVRSGANGIYKTRSCAELKMRGVSSDQLSTRDCFGVVNNGVVATGSKQ